FRYDSRDGSGAKTEYGATFHAIVNKPFTFKITPRGKVIEVKGLDAMLDAALSADPSNEGVASLLRSMLGNDSMKAMVELYQPEYPEMDMPRWEATTEGALPMGGKAKMTSVWTRQAKGVVKEIPTRAFGISGKGESVGDPVMTTFGTIRVGVGLKSMKRDGVMNVSDRDGWIVKGNTVSNGVLTMSVQLPQGNTSAGDMKMEIQTKTTMSVERVLPPK
ncbi:MAG: DUF6263 family protein, partial [Candidatus Poribacteria bacterium]|nr:DUF6263 family protein [Candidatus Poribacteria bacterium]